MRPLKTIGTKGQLVQLEDLPFNAYVLVQDVSREKGLKWAFEREIAQLNA
jgi:hypothetical protein